MADAFPICISIAQLRTLTSEGNEGHEALAEQVAGSREGAEVLLPWVEDDEEGMVPYVWDGHRLLHRSDTTAGQMLMRKAKRRSKSGAVKKRG